MRRVEPPIELHPDPDFSCVTLEELIGNGHDEKLQDAAKRFVERFEKLRPKMDLYRDLRGL
jgi:hypothetical protein